MPLTMPMTRRMRSPDERLAQRPHERDAARDRSLEEQIDAGSFRRLEELLAEVREQLLVRGHHRLARLQRGRASSDARGLDAADDLDDDVDGADRPRRTRRRR